MKIFPAIDIKEGKCTQLIGGKFGTERFLIDPFRVAEKFQQGGAERIHIIDLDAAKGIGNNLEVIKEIIKKIRVETEIGGGIRSIERAYELINAGAEKIIVGTKALQDPEFLVDLARKVGKEKIIVALDFKNKKVAIKGWEEVTDLDPIETGKNLQNYCDAFLVTCIEKEGRMEGVDYEYLKNLENLLDTFNSFWRNWLFKRYRKIKRNWNLCCCY